MSFTALRRPAARLSLGLSVLIVSPCSLAANAYSETWNGGDTASWAAATLSSAVNNPGSYLEVSRAGGVQATGAVTELPGVTGDFSGSLWTVSVDLRRVLSPEEQLLEAIFGAQPQDAWLRFRYSNPTFNGWRYQLSDKLDTSWTTYSVSFNADWSDAEALANGWQTDRPDGLGSVSWAQTMQDVYQTSVRFELDNTQRIGVDNFVLTPVPEPSSWALGLTGLAALAWRWRRQRTA